MSFPRSKKEPATTPLGVAQQIRQDLPALTNLKKIMLQWTLDGERDLYIALSFSPSQDLLALFFYLSGLAGIFLENTKVII